MSRRNPRYGSAHDKARRSWEPKVARGDIACARCGNLIEPGEPWDLDHDDSDRTRYLGPSHASCNRATSAHRVARESRGPLVERTSRDWLDPAW